MKLQFARVSLYLVELIITSISFFFTYYFLHNFHFINPFDIVPAAEIVEAPVSIDLYLYAFYVSFGIWAVLLWIRSGYRNLRVQTYGGAFKHLVVNGLIYLVIFSNAAFLLKFSFLSRFFIIFYSLQTTAALILTRIIVLYISKKARRQGRNLKNILLVGTGRRAQQFMSLVAKHPEWGYRIVGLLDKDEMLKGEDVYEYKVLGTLEELPDLLQKNVIDEVFFVTPRKWLEDVSKCILYCEAVGVPATMCTDLFDLEIATGVPKKMEDMTCLTFETRVLKGGELIVKRIFDVMASSFILGVAFPILFCVALFIRLTSQGPIFFEQFRSGRNGRTFKLYKFRSMVVDAESMLKDLRSKNEVSGPVFKITNDPRITPIGRFLRKSSLDEFPQFLNVLKGDMSIVGPRPALPNEVEEYEPWQRRRLSMKPGITCIWQVSGRNNIPFEQWMEMDLRYIDNWSLWLDLKILLKTVHTVIAGSGK